MYHCPIAESGYAITEGFGAGNSVLSRETICSSENIGGGGFTSEPVPCNLGGIFSRNVFG